MRLAIYLCEVAPFEIFQFAIRFFGVSLQFSQFESHFRDLSSKPVPLLPNALDFILKGCDLELFCRHDSKGDGEGLGLVGFGRPILIGGSFGSKHKQSR